jgi:acetyl esterase/lipase
MSSFKPLWVAVASLALLSPAISQANTGANIGTHTAGNTAQETPPGYDANCNCYRNVRYGSINWYEPTTRRMASQVMDIFMPQGTPPANGWPILYYGHPNGMNHFIAKDTNPESKYGLLVKPLLDAGYIVVAYEFRHPVVNYVAGKPAPRYDIQRAINFFANNHAVSLNADPSNSFIAGRSRGGGLGVLTALTGNFTGGTQVRAAWVYQAQTSFSCQENADTFILENERAAFLATCSEVPGAGSALQSVKPNSPPVVASYDKAFRKELVHADEADIHFPDFGWQLCLRYAAQGESGQCTPMENVPKLNAWTGMIDYFHAHKAL